MSDHDAEIMGILADAKELAQRHRALTGKPLGITGEVAEFEAARLLDVELTDARQAGYDAIRIEDGIPHRLQIKGRCVLPDAKPGQRIGKIDVTKEFDGVLMDQSFNATAIYEADRQPVIDALTAPGSALATNAAHSASANSNPSGGRCGRNSENENDGTRPGNWMAFAQ